MKRPSFLTDGHLLSRYVESGDAEAFEQLYQRTAPRLNSLARRLGVPENDREDLVQDVFLGVLSDVTRFDTKRSFSAWTGGLAWHRVLNARRRFLQRLQPSGSHEERTAAAPLERLEAAEVRRTVRRSLACLPDRYREVLELYYVEHLPAKDIARRLDRDPSTIRTQIARALQRLRDVLPPGFAPALLAVRLEWLRPGSPGWSGAAWPRGAGRPTATWPLPVRVGALGLGLASTLATVVLTRPDDVRAAVPAAAPSAAAAAAEPTSVPLAVAAERRAVDVSALAGELAAAPALSSALPSAGPEVAAVRLRFLEQVTGRPIPHFAFALERWGGGELAPASTGGGELSAGTADDRGEALVERVPLGAARVRFNSSEGSPVREIDADCDWVVRVDGVVPVEGRVVDELDRPVAGAEVWADEVVFGPHVRPCVIARTDARGSFQVTFTFGAPKKLWARLPGESCSAVRSLDLRSKQSEVAELRLRPALAVVEGRVVDASGAAAAGALVTLYSSRASLSARHVFHTPTDAEGRYRFDTLPPRLYTAVATGAGGATAEVDVDLTRTNRAEGELRLLAGALVRGSVAAAGGAVLAAVPSERERVRWELARVARVDASGTYALFGVPPGSVELLLLDPDDATVLARRSCELSDDQVLEWDPDADPSAVAVQSHRLRRHLAWLKGPGGVQGTGGLADR